ncbi:MAG: fumarylacetoacetate hydrolase family protein [Methanomassiliicoccales archaeon]|nr:fumarylacetoacetate hydrolase family protein [Methanomassiliicoccales archaeon]
MRLATFQVTTDVGKFKRVGAVVSDGRILDLNFAYATMSGAKGDAYPYESANFHLPPDMMELAKRGKQTVDIASETVKWIADKNIDRAIEGEKLYWDVKDVKILPPVTNPKVLRDFGSFESHLKKTRAKFGVNIPEAWYRRPMGFKGNPTSLVGHEDEVVWPSYTERMDYEMEICAVVGKPGRNIPLEEAADHIFGYTILDDFSARDVQAEESSNHTGPFKGKDFAWGLGPWIVTTDEFVNLDSVEMTVRINGEVWAQSSPESMKWSFAQLISYTSLDETLNTGDLIGSGSVNGGCGFENDRWVKPGDLVEVEVKDIGVLRNRIGHPDRSSPGNNWTVAARKAALSASLQH